MLQDNCLWKPPGARSLGMHQDGSFADYLVPAGDDHLLGGARRHARRGRHDRVRPRLSPLAQGAAGPGQLPRARRLARADARGHARRGGARAVPVVVKAGGCSFHHSLTFHGSGPTRRRVDRRAIVSHLVPVQTRFHPVNVDQTYSRYRRRGDLSLDESFFPVLWDETGARSAWLLRAAGRRARLRTTVSDSDRAPHARASLECPRRRLGRAVVAQLAAGVGGRRGRRRRSAPARACWTSAAAAGSSAAWPPTAARP